MKCAQIPSICLLRISVVSVFILVFFNSTRVVGASQFYRLACVILVLSRFDFSVLRISPLVFLLFVRSHEKYGMDGTG